MLDRIPTNEEMAALIGRPAFDSWRSLCAAIDENYDMERSWNSGGKKWLYEYKYRRGGKTLCALYARENCAGFMVILGKDERARFEGQRALFNAETQRLYDEATTYHDGKWIMFPLDAALFEDYMRLLAIKRKPNKMQRTTNP